MVPKLTLQLLILFSHHPSWDCLGHCCRHCHYHCCCCCRHCHHRRRHHRCRCHCCCCCGSCCRHCHRCCCRRRCHHCSRHRHVVIKVVVNIIVAVVIPPKKQTRSCQKKLLSFYPHGRRKISQKRSISFLIIHFILVLSFSCFERKLTTTTNLHPILLCLPQRIQQGDIQQPTRAGGAGMQG